MKKDKLEQEFIEQIQHSQGIIHKVCHIYCVDEEHRKDLFQEIGKVQIAIATHYQRLDELIEQQDQISTEFDSELKALE